jgi:uncharacterized protein involved in exopolysaccharide biosynthesis
MPDMSQADPSAPGPAPPQAYYVAFPPAYPQEGISLLELGRTILGRRWTVLVIALLAGAAATAYAFLKTPVYRAEVVMVPAATSESGSLTGLATQLGGLASLAGVDLGGSETEVEVAVATLKSREFTDAFVRDNDLLPVLFDRKWDASAKAWKVRDPDDAPTLRDAFERFDRKVRFVHRDRKTGLVSLRVEWKDRALAARWANQLVERVNRHRQRKAIEEAEKSIAYLHAQLRGTTVVELQQAVYRLIEAQTKKIMLANVREEYAFEVIDPAVVPDEDDFARPNRPLVIALGLMAGVLAGIGVAVVRGPVPRGGRSPTAEQPPAAA